MKRSSLIVLLYLSLVSMSFVCFLPVISAFAEPKAPSLEEIIVTATKIEEPKSDVSASVQIITQEDIKHSTSKNVGDLIAEAALGHVHKYPGALTSLISIRGLSTDLFNPLKDRVLVLINGRPAGTNNLAKIPVSDIERIEIVKGPASVLYGSAAMGGVVNIITKKGRDEGVQGFIGGEIGSRDYRQVIGELSGKKGGFDFYLAGSRSQRGDYEAKVKDIKGNPYGKNTGYDDGSISARFGYEFAGSHRISLGLQHYKTWDMGSPNAWYQADYDDNMEKERNGFDLEYKGFLDAKLYYNKDKDTWNTVGGQWAEITKTKRDSQGISLQKVFPIGDHRVIVGLQWDRMKTVSWRSVGAPYYPKSEFNSYGAFTEGRLSLLDKRLLFNVGLRYDYFQNEILPTPLMTSLNPRKEELDHLTVRSGVVYKFTENLRFKGNIGTAFRAPAPDELAMDVVQWGTRYLGNPDLKPEKSMTYDAGIEFNGLNSSNWLNGLKCGLTFFHTDFKDKISSYFDSILNAQSYKNIDGATLQGLEINLSYDVGIATGLNISIEPFTNITYHTRYSSDDPADIKAGGKTLTFTPKWTGAFGVKAGQDKWSLRFIANYTGDERATDWDPASPTYRKVIKKGDFTVAQLKAAYRPLKMLEISAAIENLFDRNYAYVLGYPMPRRTFTAGAKWVF